MNTLRQDQRGSALIAVLAAILIILIGLILFKVGSGNPSANKTSQEQTSQQQAEDDGSTQSTDTGTNALSKNARNTARKNDASMLAGATSEYVANNSGLLPQGFEDGNFTNYEYGSAIEFSHYKSTVVATGSYPAITKDEIVIVTQASCGPGSEAVEGSTRSAAILYALEADGGRWDAACLDL
jgi:hypothetical protein